MAAYSCANHRNQEQETTLANEKSQQGGDQDPHLLHVGEHTELGSEKLLARR